MKISFGDVGQLKAVFDVIAQIASEINIEIKPDLMNIYAMNEAKACQFKYVIFPSWCIEYDVTESIAFKMNVERLHKILKVGSNGTLHLEHKKSKLIVSMVCGENDNTYNIATMDPEEAAPELELYQATARFENTELKDAFEQVNILDTEAISIKMAQDKVVFMATDKLEDSRVICKKETTSKKVVGGLYGTDYLKILTLLHKSYDSMQLSLDSDSPLVGLYRSLDKSEFWMHIAPRIEED